MTEWWDEIVPGPAADLDDVEGRLESRREDLAHRFGVTGIDVQALAQSVGQLEVIVRTVADPEPGDAELLQAYLTKLLGRPVDVCDLRGGAS